MNRCIEFSQRKPLLVWVPCAVNAARHDGLNEGTDVLVLNRPFSKELAVGEARSVWSKGHRLVLQNRAEVGMYKRKIVPTQDLKTCCFFSWSIAWLRSWFLGYLFSRHVFFFLDLKHVFFFFLESYFPPWSKACFLSFFLSIFYKFPLQVEF